ncbi:uncharacterized protein [Watersipora subatra]|uniref:uncharacterized protein isoform X2 n=1 Tax=Watersipora subatra TaxID=2589382 RepID=UPI00355B524C
MDFKLLAVFVGSILIIGIVEVASQNSCQDTSKLCSQYNCTVPTVLQNCKLTCGLCTPTNTNATTNTTTTTTTTSPTTLLSLTTATDADTTSVTSEAASDATKNSMFSTMQLSNVSATDNSSVYSTGQMTVTITKVTQNKTTTSEQTTLADDIAKTLTDGSTVSITVLPNAVKQLRHAAKVSELDDGDYNMRLTAVFVGHTSAADQPIIDEAVIKTLAEFGILVKKSAVSSTQHGVSKSLQSLSLTTMSWNLSVFSTNKEQNSSQLIERLQANPLLGFNIEKNLPVAVPNTLFGGNDFIIHAPPTPKATTTTTAKPMRVTDWNMIGITIGAGLGLVLLLLVTAIVYHRLGRVHKMNLEEGKYDIEVSVRPNSNVPAEDTIAKTHL